MHDATYMYGSCSEASEYKCVCVRRHRPWRRAVRHDASCAAHPQQQPCSHAGEVCALTSAAAGDCPPSSQQDAAPFPASSTASTSDSAAPSRRQAMQAAAMAAVAALTAQPDPAAAVGDSPLMVAPPTSQPLQGGSRAPRGDTLRRFGRVCRCALVSECSLSDRRNYLSDRSISKSLCPRRMH